MAVAYQLSNRYIGSFVEDEAKYDQYPMLINPILLPVRDKVWESW